MKKLSVLITLLALIAIWPSPGRAAGNGNNAMSLPPLETNAAVGVLPASLTDTQYPHGRNNFRPTSHDPRLMSVVPEAKRYICSNGDCQCSAGTANR